MNPLASSHSSRTSAVVRAMVGTVTALVIALVPTLLSGVPASQASVGTTTAAVLPRAAAVGRLTPTGCSGPASAVSCDLYAMTGETQLLGTTVPIWGFSSTSTAGTATAPGPTLVVNEGDRVTITVHNGLSQSLSLALPGQPADQIGAGLNDTTGADPGGTASYTFRASRARHVPLRGRPHAQRSAAGRHGPGRGAGCPGERRHGIGADLPGRVGGRAE